jgi:NAD(P)-dependent dehydrogenase (short-subunit alcohol dehydrogenase family)
LASPAGKSRSPLLENLGTKIVNVSSTFGQKAAAALSDYAASEAALEQVTRR